MKTKELAKPPTKKTYLTGMNIHPGDILACTSETVELIITSCNSGNWPQILKEIATLTTLESLSIAFYMVYPDITTCLHSMLSLKQLIIGSELLIKETSS